MKRGLVLLDHDEVAQDEWTGRITTLQEELRDAGADIGLIYNDVSRGDDIGYLTNLVIYWNEGVLAVPASGDAALLTKLSKRVQTWMRRTSTVEEIHSGPSFGGLVADYAADRSAGTIGLIDAELWPASIVAEIDASLPEGWTVKPLGPIVRDRRAFPSTAEQALLKTGAEVLREALADATVAGLDASERVARLERRARRGGFVDVLFRNDVAGDHQTVEASGQYRHGWLMIGRTFGPDAWLDQLAEAQHAAFAALRADVDWVDVERAAQHALTGAPAGSVVAIRWIAQGDIETGGELQPPRAQTPSAGEVCAVVLEVVAPQGTRSVLTDTVLVTESGTTPLTTETPFPSTAHRTGDADKENRG